MSYNCILINGWTGSALLYLTLDPDQQEPLYQLNRIIMMLLNTSSRSAGAFIPVEPDQPDVI